MLLYNKTRVVGNLGFGSRHPKIMFLPQRGFTYPRGTEGRDKDKDRR